MAAPAFVPLLRGLRNQPGFSLLAILTLALGIGVNLAIFSALDALVLNPLPFPQADRLAAVYEDASFIGYAQNTPAPANFFDWKRPSQSFEDIGATRFCRAVLTGDGAPEQVLCRSFTASMWTILGVQPIRGRWFTAAEDHPDPDAVLIGEGLWTRRYARDESIIGRTIVINDASFRVAGPPLRGGGPRGAADVAIVNETFARVYFPGESAIGKRMSLNEAAIPADRAKRRWRTIVGVVKEVRERGYDPAPKPVTYVPIHQTAGWYAGQLIVRARQGEVTALLNTIRQTILDADPDQPIGQARTFDEILALDQASRRQQMVLLSLFAALSLVMACLGIYAILAYSVELRRQEIGVRMALGADWDNVMRLIAGDGMRLALAGALVGVLAAAAGGRVLQSSL